MDFEKLKYLLRDEASYRLKQAENAIYADMIDSWDKATVLPKKIRDILDREMPVDFDFKTIKSVDKSTLKALVMLCDGLLIETVLLQHQGPKSGRNTVCVSSQAGCPMGCIFCRTAKVGYTRNLSSYEITNQVLFFKYFLKKINGSISNVVFMGMGEPFLNYENVIDAIRILNEKDKFNIGARKISISTCGIPGGIEKLAKENLQVNLAVSLNAPDDELRSRLMPVNRKYPLKLLMPAVENYIKKTNRRVMFEYILIKGLNDSPSCAKDISALLKGLLCFVNLIPFNDSGDIVAPSRKTISTFKNILEDRGIAVTQRHSFGRDISAACGQLVYSGTL